MNPSTGAPDPKDSRSQRNRRWTPGEMRLEQTLWRARLALFWERLWPRLAPAATVAALFVALVLFDVFPSLPFWIHVAALVLFALAFLAVLIRAPLGLRWPTSAESRRRVEVASELRHRPLETLTEPIAVGADDPQTRALWAAHQARAKAALDALKSGIAAPGLARLDPYAIRFAVLLLLAIGAAVGFGDGEKRFARAFDPLTELAKPEPVHIGAWITPPGYTGLPPIVLAFGDKNNKDDAPRKDTKGRAPGPITVPEGSSLLVEVDGGTRVPTLRVGNDKQPLESVGERAFRVESLIGSGSSIVVERRGSKLAEWPINVVSDQEPTVAFTEPPAPNERGQIKIAVEGQDDYGVASLVAYVRFAERGIDDPPMEIPLPLPGDRTKFKQTTLQDLTSSPWSGLEVTIQVMARDAVDQVGVTEAVPLTLPERQFRNPLARALIALRKELVRNPSARVPARNAIDGLLRTPDKLPDDSVVRLALSASAGRLRYDGSRKGVLAVAQLLWETALRLEDGAIASAQRELTAKQRELMDRLNDKTGDAELDKLFDEVRDALAKALEEAMKNMANMPPWEMPLPPDAQVMSADDLFRQLEEARDLAKSGSRDAARERLQQMQSMLDALRNGSIARMTPEQMQQMREANELSKKLNELAQRQKQLMDQTFQRSQRGQRGQRGAPQDEAGAAEQQSQLQRELDELMQQLGEMTGQVPGNLGEAGKAMRESADALGQGNPGAALDPQGRALQALQQGSGQAAQMMAQAMGLRGFMPGGTQTPRAGDGRNTDPFGRPMPAVGSSNGDEVKIPDASERARAREILDELRRRSAEPDRPRIEHDYIDRLLRRF